MVSSLRFNYFFVLIITVKTLIAAEDLKISNYLFNGSNKYFASVNKLLK